MGRSNWELIHRGSVKEKYRVGPGEIAFVFSNRFSAFDIGPHPQTIPGKAQAVCACAVKSFQIARQVGVPTHFIEQVDDVTILLHGAQVITDHHLTTRDTNYVVPVEWISRFRVAGSIDRDFRQGRKKPTDYGFSTDIPPVLGTPFPYPVHQSTTKFERIDREISQEESRVMAGLSVRDVEEYWAMIDRLNGAIGLVASWAGFVHLDGKMECVMGPDRAKMIADVFGTQDEDRFCPVAQLEKGELVHYGKEYMRQLFIKNGLYKELNEARVAGKPDPSYPPLAPDEVEEITKRYVTFAELYAGVTIKV